MTFTYFTEDLTNVKNIFQEARELGNRLDLYDTIATMRGRSGSRGSGFGRSYRGPRGSGLDRSVTRGSSGFDRVRSRESMSRDMRSRGGFRGSMRR